MASTMTSSYSAPRASAVRTSTDTATSAKTAVRYDAASGLSAMLLAAMVSALVVVADQLIDTWADGHLLFAWVALWAVGFAALAIFGGAARRLAAAAMVALDDWSQDVAQARADKRLWAIAQSDPRVMADLQMAISRGTLEVSGVSTPSRWAALVDKLQSAKASSLERRAYLPYL